MNELLAIAMGKQAGGGVKPQGEIDIIANGEYDVTEYATANVNVPLGGAKASINTSPEIVANAGITPTATITIREE